MQDAVPMRGGDGSADRDQYLGRFARRQRAVLQSLRQRRALDQRHDEERLPVEFADLMHRDDMRMLELRGGFSLGPEAREVRRGRQPSGQNHLQRDRAVQTDLRCAIDDSHAAATDLFEQFKIADAARKHGRARLPPSRLRGKL